MIIRESLARNLSGGPEFRIRSDKLIVEVDDNGGLSSIAEDTFKERPDVLQSGPASMQRMALVNNQLSRLGFEVKQLDNLGVVVAESEKVSDIVTNIQDARNQFSDKAVENVKSAVDAAESTANNTILGGWTPGNMDFFDSGDTPPEDSVAALEANLRNELNNISLKNPITEAVSELDGVANVELAFTRATFGPLSLNVDVDSVESRLSEFMGESGKPDKDDADLTTVADARKRMGVGSAWENTTGEDAIVAVFDTSFCGEFLDNSRLIDSFSAKGVDSAFSAPEEGHGTMCAVSAVGNTEDGAPVDGVAKDADFLLARLTDKDGALSKVEEAWDWLVQKANELDRPIISSHSYGIPLCSGRQMDMCESTQTKVVRAANKRTDHQSLHAAGNEGLYCGHRLAGMTNGIMGTNSDPSTITVGALRMDVPDAQPYSSHGWGTCSGLDKNPKPDVSAAIPKLLPYACDVKDMSSTSGGSSGGTSEATPLVAGAAALIASETGEARRGDIEDILENTAKTPRKTQINQVLGHDARFGYGQVRAQEAIEEALSRVSN